MNEDIAPFELAVKLKVKGFRERVKGYYKESKILSVCNTPMNSNALNNKFSAPTIPQVLKWLRNTHNLHVETYPCGLGMWKFLVTNIITLEERALCDKYTSSEQAEIAGISYVLDNLI